jgi:hypothetical protein
VGLAVLVAALGVAALDGRWAHAETPAARADEPVDRALITILPLTATDDSLQIYRRVIATSLAAELGGLAGTTVRALSLDGAVPVHVAFVIDGRIVGTASGQVAIEIGVRDPETGADVARLASRAAPLGDIDGLVVEVGQKLRPLLGRAVADKRARRAARAETVTMPAAPGASTTASPAGVSAPPVTEGRRQVIVRPVVGAVADGAVPVARIATDEAYRMIEELGYRPVAEGDAALATLAMDVQELRFSWQGVLLARAWVRVELIAADGRVLTDRRVRTGTVVGGRGDAHAALVRFAARQALVIVSPQLRRALAAARAAQE